VSLRLDAVSEAQPTAAVNLSLQILLTYCVRNLGLLPTI